MSELLSPPPYPDIIHHHQQLHQFPSGILLSEYRSAILSQRWNDAATILENVAEHKFDDGDEQLTDVRKVKKLAPAVENEPENNTGSMIENTTRSAASSSSLLYLHHDLSLLHFRLHNFPSALVHTSRALECYRGGKIAAAIESESSTADLISPLSAPTTSELTERRKRGTLTIEGDSIHAKMIRRILLEEPQRRDASLEECIAICSECVVQDIEVEDSSSAEASTSSTRASTSTPFAHIPHLPSSLHLPLLLRHFFLSIQFQSQHPNHLQTAFETGVKLINIISSTNQIRETLLDECESSLLSSNPNHTLPLLTRYAHVMSAYQFVLRDIGLRRMGEVKKEKEEGTKQWELAVKKEKEKEEVLQNGAGASSSSVSNLSSSSTFASHYRLALHHYELALSHCASLWHLLTSPLTCPSIIWFTVLSADSGWCREQAEWIHAQLRANAAVCALKCAEVCTEMYDGEGGDAKDEDAASISAASFSSTTASSASSTSLAATSSPSVIASSYLSLSRHHSSLGLHALSSLQRQLTSIRAAVETAEKKEKKIVDQAADVDEDDGKEIMIMDDDEDDDEAQHEFRIFIDHPSLVSSLPFDRAVILLQAKLHLRHGTSWYSDMSPSVDRVKADQRAEASWSEALRLHEDGCKKEIGMRRRQREEMKVKQHASSTVPASQLVGIELNPGPSRLSFTTFSMLSSFLFISLSVNDNKLVKYAARRTCSTHIEGLNPC